MSDDLIVEELVDPVVWICFPNGRMERDRTDPRPGCQSRPTKHARCGWYRLAAQKDDPETVEG